MARGLLCLSAMHRLVITKCTFLTFRHLQGPRNLQRALTLKFQLKATKDGSQRGKKRPEKRKIRMKI